MVKMETIEIEKLVYPRNNPEGKVSVRYYINTDLKPKISELGEELYPLYIKIAVKRQQTKIRSLAEVSLISKENFEKIEKVINYHTIEEFNNEFNSGSDLLTSFDDNVLYFEMTYPFLKEKHLLFDIIERLNPFNKPNFDIKDVVEWFDLYNSKLSIGINRVLKIGMKELLEREEVAQNEMAKVYVRSLDWEKGKAYDLWLILKDMSPLYQEFMKVCGRCFQITASHNINNLSENEVCILNEIADESLKDMNIKIKLKEFIYKNHEYDKILKEISFLFFES